MCRRDANSKTRYGRPCSSPMSSSDAMFGWESVLAALRILEESLSLDGIAGNLRASILIATVRPRRVSRAR